MRFRNSTAAAVCVLAAGLALGGCETGGSGGSSGGAVATPAANASSNAQAGSATSAAASSPGPQASAASSPGSQAGAAGTQAGAPRGTCQPWNLSFALGAKTKTSGPRSQTRQTVDLTNRASSACTLNGFPGVDLVGVARGKQDYSWSLARRPGRHSKVWLKPGRTAHFDVVYLPTSSGNINNITVTKMVITPPNVHTQAELTWSPFVLLQDKAKHPGTYVSPIVSGP
jgi:hypothetical protein